MNNNVKEEDKIEQKPTTSIELDPSCSDGSIELDPSCSDGGVIEHPLSTFNNLLEKAVTEFILKRETDEDFNELNVLRASVQRWRSKYKNLKRQAKLLKFDVQHLMRDLKENNLAQPIELSQFVNSSTKLPMANACEKSKNIPELVISDSDDDDVTENDDIINDLIDSDDDTQYSMVKYGPGTKSKTNVSIQDLKINDNDNVLPINTEASTSLSNEKCSSTAIRKRKPGPKSKTMIVDNIVPENKETVVKKMYLNKSDVTNNKEAN